MTYDQILTQILAYVCSLDIVIDVVLSIIICKIYRVMALHLQYEAETNEFESHAILWLTTFSVWIIYKCRLFE